MKRPLLPNPIMFLALGVLMTPTVAFAQKKPDDKPKPDFSNEKAKSEITFEKDVTYGEAAKEKLLLNIFRPANGKGPRPAVLFLHGGGWSGGSKSQFDWHARDLAGRGYVAFTIGYRLAPKDTYPAALDDCQRAVRWVRANADKYGIDPNKVVAIGSSSGGHLAALLGVRDTRDNGDPVLAKFSSRVNAVVDYFGPLDFTPQSTLPPGAMNIVQRFIGKPPSAAPELYKEASPVTHVSKEAAPFLFIHGTKDTSIPISQSEKLMELLKKVKVEATLVKIEGAGHSFHNRLDSDHAKQAWQAALSFLEQRFKK